MAQLRNSHVVFLVGDIAATVEWYEGIGFEVEVFPPSPPHAFGILSRDDVVIMLQQLDGYVKPDLYEKRNGGVWNVYIDTDDVSALHEELSQRPDVNILQGPHRQPYGQLELEVVDPNGYVLVFAQALL